MTMTFANTMDRNKNQNRAPSGKKKQAITVMMIIIILITNDIDDNDK